jgi:aconitate hydratase
VKNPQNITQKIISAHLVSGEMLAGQEISIRIDQTLTQDSTGTMAYLQFEAMGIPRVKTKRSVAYIDHNMLQSGPENADDHRFIETVAKKYGIMFSKAGNGICHQVHLERFGIPGQTLLGSDSHTPTCGGLGMLAIGAGGLDVAVAMGGGAYYLAMPKVIRVELVGKLGAWSTAKDVILEILRQLTVKGGVGKVLEYTGKGVATLSVPERATITNMGAELGATTSIFPSDNKTKEFLIAQGRGSDFVPLEADKTAEYDQEITIDLGTIKPLAACPHSPDNVKPISEIAGLRVDQVAIGSCTNSSFQDMMRVAAILRGKTVADHISLVISPGSKQVLAMLAQNGALGNMLSAGARILESGCGPCIGMGQAPSTDAVSLRTFNRNFQGRSGTNSAQVYLVSPETAAISAIKGVITDPSTLGNPPTILMPKNFAVDDSAIIKPAPQGTEVEIIRGPNIKPFPIGKPVPNILQGEVLITLGDNITTDDIMPSGARLLPYRSNIPYLADYCLTPCDPQFPARAKAKNGGFIVGGINYGQGSSREHAALVPLYLGIVGVIAKSFARIHLNNLINAGIVPILADSTQYKVGDQIKLDLDTLVASNRIPATQRQLEILRAGGLLNYTKNKGGNNE